MIAPALCLTLGLLLAQRHRVSVLVPASLLVVIAALLSADALWPKVLTTGLWVVSLQAGYLLGVAIRVTVSATKTESKPTLHRPAANGALAIKPFNSSVGDE